MRPARRDPNLEWHVARLPDGTTVNRPVFTSGQVGGDLLLGRFERSGGSRTGWRDVADLAVKAAVVELRRRRGG